MKCFRVFSFVLLTVFGASTRAEMAERFGLGVSVGSPVGVVADIPVADRLLLRGYGGNKSGSSQRGIFAIDGVYRWPGLIRIGRARVPIEAGIGVSYQPAFENWGEVTALRLPLGIYYDFIDAPLEIGLSFGKNLTHSNQEGFDQTDITSRLVYKFD